MSTNSNNNIYRPQKLIKSNNTNLRLFDIDNTSLQQEDFFSFGDFTKDELNIYLNKNKQTTHKQSNNLNDNNLYELNNINNNNSNNSSTFESNTSTPTSNSLILIPDNSSLSLHGVNVPWQINNKQDSPSTSTNTNNIHSSKNFQFNFIDTNNLRKESNTSSTNSSYSPSSPQSSTSSQKQNNGILFLSESSESLLSSDSISKLNHISAKMDTQIEKPITLNNTTTSNDTNNGNSSSDQQRRNKKRKPPNYYQSAEYAAILKTTDQTALINDSTTSTTITTTNTTSTTFTSNESSNDLNHTNDISNKNNANTVISDVNNSQNLINEKKINNNNTHLVNNNSSNLTNSTTKTTSNIDDNNSIEQIEKVNDSNAKVNDNLETNIQKIQNLTLKTNESLDNSLATNKNETKQSQAPATTTTTVTNSATTTTQSSAPSAKCWSSLFKSSVAQPSTQQQQQPQPVTTSQQTNTTNNNTNNKQNNKSKQALTSSASLPISSSVSSVSSSSSNSSNHVHLNGVSNNHSVNNNNTTNSQLDQPSNDVLKLLGTMFKQCELKHSAPALQPRGIRNKQNWCYVNATLQALLACPPFYNLIKSIFMKIKSSNTNIKNVPCIASLGRFISEFKTMVRVQSHNNDKQTNSSSNLSYKELVIGEPFEVDYFYDTLASLKAELTFKTGRQEDAQEFLSFLLNRLHDEMVRCLESLNQNANTNENANATNNLNDHSKTNGSGINHINNNQDEQADEDDEWKEVGKKNRSFVTRKTEFKQSPLSDIFCGQFRSALSQPGVKDKESVSLEPFFTLPLDIQSDSVKNVREALEHFVQKEEVFGFTNQETKQEIEAFKRISFEDLPPVLILYLKCFVYDKQGGIQKLLKRIDFQIDLEINKDLISPNQRSKLKDKKRNYKLFAVEYHHGDKANGGHYITDVYHPGIIGWVRYDDANVKVINNAQVLKSEDKKLIPYLLYYRRADLI